MNRLPKNVLFALTCTGLFALLIYMYNDDKPRSHSKTNIAMIEVLIDAIEPPDVVFKSKAVLTGAGQIQDLIDCFIGYDSEKRLGIKPMSRSAATLTITYSDGQSRSIVTDFCYWQDRYGQSSVDKNALEIVLALPEVANAEGYGKFSERFREYVAAAQRSRQ